MHWLIWDPSESFLWRNEVHVFGNRFLLDHQDFWFIQWAYHDLTASNRRLPRLICGKFSVDQCLHVRCPCWRANIQFVQLLRDERHGLVGACRWNIRTNRCAWFYPLGPVLLMHTLFLRSAHFYQYDVRNTDQLNQDRVASNFWQSLHEYILHRHESYVCGPDQICWQI